MRTNLLKWGVQAVLLIAAIVFTACDDDEKPKTEPVLATAAVTEVTTTTAKGGGEITDDGNAKITVSGLVYSSTNATPTIADSKTEETVTSGAFTSNLEGLTSGTTYHIRAYATNSVGTGYGAIVDFTTGNSAPTALNVSISGVAEVNKILTATYTYSDSENNAESGTTFQWYKADTNGGAETAITGATASTYHLEDADEFKYIRVAVTPMAATGTTTGVATKSAFSGSVAVRTTITFVYNSIEVTYGIITSPVSGRKWLDRNLGAPNAPTSYNDFANYGDLFQWGRAANGHQIVTRTGPTAATGAATTTTSSTTDSPSALFILNSASPFDWRNPPNSNLWQGVNGINNPCPAGFRLPTEGEWTAETLTTVQAGYTQMKLTLGGSRSPTTGNFSGIAGFGIYWSSSVDPAFPTYSYMLDIYGSGADIYFDNRGAGRSCRCIKD